MPPPPPDGTGGASRSGFYATLDAAIADFIERGFDSQQRLDMWLDRIRRAATESLVPQSVVEQAMRDAMMQVYRRQVERGTILKLHPGVPRFTLERVRPQLRAELDRRIMASAGLIRLNRDRMIEVTLQRFAGWSTSIPAGGTDAADKRETGQELRKALKQLPYEERRVAIDQSHKLFGNLNNIIAIDGGAVAGMWRSNWRQANYDYRPDHKERDGKVYGIRGNWAAERGLVNKGAGWMDEMTAAGEEIFCRCSVRYIYNLRDLPPEMLTEKGRIELERIRVGRAA